MSMIEGVQMGILFLYKLLNSPEKVIRREK
ncbi:hypothetical protein CYOC110262_26260 [Cytobacillus oceanisediminis]